MLIDTHCHLDCEPLVSQLDQLLTEARSAGIGQWVVPGVNPAGWDKLRQLCSRRPDLLPAYGIHPLSAAEGGDEQLATLDLLALEAVAIGEIGLDRQAGDLQRQEQLLREQLRIARRHNLPVLLHCRGGIDRLLNILQEERACEVGGIMHAFSGSLESAHACIRLGFAISLAGTLTFQNAVKPQRLAEVLPLDRLVLESDAPDMTPQRHRGQFNRPAWMLETAQRLAEIKGLPLQQVAEATSNTARRYLRLV